jgi:hypothetical protein
VVPSSYTVDRFYFLGRVVRMVVLGFFVGVFPIMHGRRKDTHDEVCGYNSLYHAWCVAIMNTTAHAGAWVGKISAHVMHSCLIYNCALCTTISQTNVHQ